MPFPLPASILQNCDGGTFYCLSVWANTVTTGYFWTLALLSFIAVLYMGTMRLGSNRAFGFSTGVGLMAAVWLAVLQLIPWSIASGFILAGLAGIATLLMSNK